MGNRNQFPFRRHFVQTRCISRNAARIGLSCWRAVPGARRNGDNRRAKALAALLDLAKEMSMSKGIKVADLPDFDASRYLDGEEAIAVYLTDILTANDPALLAAALGDIARARGMSEIARASGLTREALNKALRPDAQPRFDTMSRVCSALGVRLVAQAEHV
jgi:probable addiction module antidote protein